MKETLLQLKKLQDVDNLNVTLSRSLQENSLQQEALVKVLATGQEQLNQSQQQQKERKAKHRELETQVADLDKKRQSTEERQLMAANKAEMEALDRQHQTLAASLDEVENQTLELLDLMESQEVELKKQVKVVAEEQAETRKQKELLAMDVKDIEDELSRLKIVREELSSALPASVWSKYQEISQNRAGRAVSSASGGLCQVCRLSLPPQLLNELQKQEKMLHCPHCTRFLYWGDAPDVQVQAS